MSITVDDIWRADAIEALAENERVIVAQRARIEELEFHLGKCRDAAYQICYATVGVLPLEFASDAKPKKPSKTEKKAVP